MGGAWIRGYFNTTKQKQRHGEEQLSQALLTVLNTRRVESGLYENVLQIILIGTNAYEHMPCIYIHLYITYTCTCIHRDLVCIHPSTCTVAMWYDLGHVSAVGGGAGHSRVSGEADLVVDHDVDGTVSGVVWQV